MAHRIGRNTALAIGWACQGNQVVDAGYAVFYFYGIPHRPDMWVAGLHEFIHLDTAKGSDFQTGGAGQFNFRAHTDGQDDHVHLFGFS